jgi:hypothetical protein
MEKYLIIAIMGIAFWSTATNIHKNYVEYSRSKKAKSKDKH